MRKGLGILAAAVALAGIHAQAATVSNHSNKETVIEFKKRPTPVYFKNEFGGFGGANKIGWNKGVCNQRQYRKWMRQTPQMRKSKKARK